MKQFEKLMQIVNYLLRKYDYSLNYTKLIKILYLCEKESYKTRSIPITDSYLCSMHNGPVLSELYDLICGRAPQPEQANWNNYFLKDGYNLKSIIKDELPDGKLSRAEKRIVDEIDSNYHDTTFGELIDLTHNPEKFPEWEDTTSSLPIDPHTLLKSVGHSDVEIEEIIIENERLNADYHFYSECCS